VTILQELVLSIATSTAVKGTKDLCNLLAVSKGLQAAIRSRQGNSRWQLEFTCQIGNLARTVSFVCWLQKYHMLVNVLLVDCDTEASQQQAADAHALAMSLGLRPPLKLASLNITHPTPLKLLQQVDAQQLTSLKLSQMISAPGGSPPALIAEIGRLCNLQELTFHFCLQLDADHHAPLAVAEMGACSSLSQLTALKRLHVCSRMPPAFWQHIPPQLSSLLNFWMDDAQLRNMRELVQLQELHLGCGSVTGAMLTAAGRHMPQLRQLGFSAANEVVGAREQLQALHTLPALQRLSVYQLPTFAEQDVAIIAQASSLTRLHISLNLSRADSLTLAGLTALKHLVDLGFVCHAWQQSAVVTTFGHLLTQLKQLSLKVSLHAVALAQVRELC
jgi:hypothetical protein